MAKIFLNYYHDERKRAREITLGLEKQGHQILSLKSGQNWRSDLIPLLYKCDVVVILLTQLSVKHDWTILEWSIAYSIFLLRKHPALLPVRLEDVKYPEPLDDLGHRIDAVKDKLDDKQIIDEIIAAIGEQVIGPKIFISHSHSNKDVSKLLVNVLEQAFIASKVDIRASSLTGHGLLIGASTPEQIRKEIEGAEAVMGIMTPESIKSQYVLFELGAAWGFEKQIYPLLAHGTSKEDLPGPLKERNCIELSNSSSCYEMIDQLKKQKILDAKESAESIVHEAIQNLTNVAAKVV